MMSYDEILENLDQLQKFCERKAVSRWKEDEIMWTRYANTIKETKTIIENTKGVNTKR